MKKQQEASISSASNSSSIISHEGMVQHKMPALASEAEFAFSFNVPTSQIVDLFEETTNEMKFELIEAEQNHATAIKHGKKSFMQVIDCFNWWSEGNMTAIKMTISTREKDSKRVCKIRGLVGSRKQVGNFIDKFKAKSSDLQASSKNIYGNEQEQQQISETQTNPFYLESCAAYMFHKILSNEKYGLGSILHKSIQNYMTEFGDGDKSKGNRAELLPLAMKKAVTMCEEIVSNLYKDFNYGRHEMEQIMPYCRISVEKYVFEKIHATLSGLYKIKNEGNCGRYEEKVAKIVTEMSPLEIFEDIGLSEHLHFCGDSHGSINTKGHLLKTPTAEKYSKATKEFERITNTQSPRQKVKHCQIMFTYLKTIIFEESKGKYELFNMEDIIPVLILILLLSGVKNVKNEIDMMVDFIGFDPCDLESERRLVVNISESYNYIWRDWKK